MDQNYSSISGNSSTSSASNDIKSDPEDKRVEEDNSGEKTNPVFLGRSIKLIDYIEKNCQTYHPALAECQHEGSLQPLFDRTVTLRPVRSEIIPMSSDEVNLLSGRLANTNELSRYREYLKSHNSVLINGVEHEVHKLSERTPLLYQYFSRSDDSKITDEYVEIFRNNCRLEPDRKTVILTDSYYINEHDQQVFKRLAVEFDHVKLFDISQLSDELFVDDVKIQRLHPTGSRPIFVIEPPADGGYSETYSQYWEYLDFARILAICFCDQVFKESFDEGNSGCIYLDWDFILKNRIGEVNIAGGISCYVPDKFSQHNDNVVEHEIRIDNSLMAVSQAEAGLIQ